MEPKAALDNRRKNSAGSLYCSLVTAPQRRLSRHTDDAYAALAIAPQRRLSRHSDDAHAALPAVIRSPVVEQQQAWPANPIGRPAPPGSQPQEPSKPPQPPPDASPPKKPPAAPTSSSSTDFYGGAYARVLFVILVMLFVVSLFAFIILYRLLLEHSQLSTPALEERDEKMMEVSTATAFQSTPAPQKPAPSGGIRPTESPSSTAPEVGAPTDAHYEVSTGTKANTDKMDEEINAAASPQGVID
ncbi:uncharacterized protein LOC144167625 [Haemaphysalis longicornis]